MFAKNQPNHSPSQLLSGCFIINSQQVNIPSKQLPLRKATYHIDIINALSEVTFVQQYENNTDKFLEIVYKFPISLSVCIHRFSATFSKRRIEGIVKQKEEAKKQYSEAVSEGRKTAYGQVDPESKDIMILKIGNIDPKQKVTIQIAYIQELSLCLNTFYKFTLPIRNNPRYLNKISNNQFINSFRKKSYIEEGYFQWDFKMTLKSSRKILAYQSTSHQLVTDFANDTSTQMSITLGNGSALDKDFVFMYSTQDFQIPNYTLGRTDNGSTVMVSFIPKFCTLNLQDAKKEALKADKFETDMDSAKGEYIFLLDRSGSMEGTRITKAKQALILFLKSLPIDSYFNIGSFGSQFEFTFPNSIKCSTKTISDAVQKVQKMDADMGGTEIQKPLKKILSTNIIEGYPKLIYFLTDGEVNNTESVIDLVKKNVKYSRINAIGVGDGASEALIKGCANKGKGHYTFIYNKQNPSQKIIQLLNDSLSAVISKVQLSYDKDLVQSIVPNPTSMPYVLKGEVVNFYLTFKGQMQETTLVSLAYEDSQNHLPFHSQIQINPESSSYSFVDIIGHYKSIKALEQAQQDKIDSLYSVKQFQGRKKIIQLSQKYNVLSKYTAFVCTEKEIVDGKYQEVKSIGQIAIQIKKSKSGEPEYSNFLTSSSNFSFGFSVPPPPPPPPIPQIPNISLILPPPPAYFAREPSAPPPCLPFSSSASKSFYDILLPTSYGAVPPPSTSAPPPSYPTSNILSSFNLNNNVPQQQQLLQLRDFSNQQAFEYKVIDFDMFQCLPQTQRKEDTLKEQVKVQDPFSIFKQQIHLYQKQNFIQHNLIEFQHKKMEQKHPSQMNKYSVDNVIKQQHFEGFWSALHLIQNLFGYQLAQTIKNRNDLTSVITFLILKWLEKNHREKEYQLIIKKTTNWLKKQNNKDYSNQFKTFIL